MQHSAAFEPELRLPMGQKVCWRPITGHRLVGRNMGIDQASEHQILLAPCTYARFLANSLIWERPRVRASSQNASEQ
jgi:hypothetical protein